MADRTTIGNAPDGVPLAGAESAAGGGGTALARLLGPAGARSS
ncbi:hypothetical protein ACWEFL_13325 [Streptomyces sp. NPDC004838]